MLIKRIITALIAIPLLLLIIVWGGTQLFLIIIMLAGGFALIEFYTMTLRTSGFLKIPGLVMGMCLLWCIHHYHDYLACDGTRYGGGPVMLLIALPTLGTMLYLLMQFMVYPRRLMGKGNIFMMLTGILYICLFLSYLILLYHGAQGTKWVLFLVLVLWCGDSGAYGAGRWLGKHFLAPQVSPRKTIEGACGGIALSLCAAGAAQVTFFNHLSITQALWLGLIISLAGLVGDLCESTIKRQCGVKDSGTILPGHGGMLDRIDSLLFVAPLTYYYKLLIA